MPSVTRRTMNTLSFAQNTTQSRMPSASRARFTQGELCSSCSSSAIDSVLRAGHFARPAIYFEKFVKPRIVDTAVALHRALDPPRDTTERNTTRQEQAYRLLIRRTKDRGKRPSCRRCLVSE